MKNRLKELREKKGLTTRQLAEELGLKTHSMICRYELGKTEGMKFELIKKFCDYFKVTPNYLLGYEESNTEELKAHYEAKVAELEDVCERRNKGLLKSFEKTLDLMEKEIDKKDLEIKLLKDIVLKQAFLLGGNINGITEEKKS